MLTRYHANADDASFVLLAAIDLLGGEVVRLRQGAFDQATTFSSDPVALADDFVEAGARWLHVVDLDGARVGEPKQADVLERIVGAVGDRARVEIAGGLRSKESVAKGLTGGASRVVLGTVALRDPTLVGELVERYGPDAVAIAIDIRDGLAVGEGWREGAPGRRAEDVIVELASVGARWFEVTAIERDGLLEGPDLPLLRRMVALDAGQIIASGGISSIDDLEAVRDAGSAGAIVGRAIYEGRIDLIEAISALAFDRE